jgi:membrane protein implicated in regulation of membrane protease activity
MAALENLYFAHPFWIWLAVAAIFLAVEMPTGTGWLLWPSACAALLALLMLVGIRLGFGGEVALYAGLTVVATLVSRLVFPRKPHTTPDINDRTGALIGKTGQAVAAFKHGRGRVLVDGAEWDAEIEFGDPPVAGGSVEVVRVLGGAKLAVRPI